MQSLSPTHFHKVDVQLPPRSPLCIVCPNHTRAGQISITRGGVFAEEREARQQRLCSSRNLGRSSEADHREEADPGGSLR